MDVAEYFYADLFVRNPHLRDMFPIGMSGQRDKLLRALGHIVSQVDDLPALVPFLRQLGRDHRKFGIVAEHYPHVGASLLATLRHFSGESWTADMESDWNAAYSLVAKVMREAADEDALSTPAWWEGQVVAVERRRFDIGVLRVRPDRPLPYRPGQSVALEVPSRLRLWRYYSMANAPRPDNTVDFHVRLVDGGPVSPVLVRGTETGDRVRMGAPVGALTLDEESPRNVLLVAGSTGLAPLKAILEQISRRPAPPRVHLFFGARTRDGRYDLEDLAKMAGGFPWLTVVPAVSDEPGHGFSALLHPGGDAGPAGAPAGRRAACDGTRDRLPARLQRRLPLAPALLPGGAAPQRGRVGVRRTRAGPRPADRPIGTAGAGFHRAAWANTPLGGRPPRVAQSGKLGTLWNT